jgi:hypothetical protein
MQFKEWLNFIERFTEPPSLGDPARRPDLIHAGTGGCPELPMGMRTACQPTTSAFSTYELKRKKSKSVKLI